MISRLGGEAVRPLGQRFLSLSCRSAPAPLVARRGDIEGLLSLHVQGWREQLFR
jgi:hypothetical protein